MIVRSALSSETGSPSEIGGSVKDGPQGPARRDLHADGSAVRADGTPAAQMARSSLDSPSTSGTRRSVPWGAGLIGISARTTDLDHRQGKDCWCVPTVEQYEHADVVIHNDPKAKGGES